MKAAELFTLPKSIPFSDYFKNEVSPVDWLNNIKTALKEFDFLENEPFRKHLPGGFEVGDNVYIHPSVKMPPYGCIQGSAWIGANTEIRPGAFIRSNVIIGNHCVIGNSCEYKNCLLMDNVQTPHYNYVGDSILGSGAHLAAGVILANLRLDQENIEIKGLGGRESTGLRKVGAFIGEGAEVGCNAVLQPGAVLGKRSIVMPTLAFGGYLAEGQIAYDGRDIKIKVRAE